MKELVEIDHLPRWAYTDDEWLELKLAADKIVSGVLYSYRDIEPDAIEILQKQQIQNNIDVNTMMNML